MVVAGPAAEASGSAEVRFVHAVPGAGKAELVVKGGSPIGGPIAFGQVTQYSTVPAGSHEVVLQSGSKALASAQVDFANGQRYSGGALAKGKGGQVRPYTDGGATDGRARLRLVHAAPELGSPDVRLGKQTVAEGVKFTEATPYLTVSPGTYTLEVTKPGGGGS